jgi:hypothetical protein
VSQPEICLNICRRLAWLGLNIDATANLANAETISVAGSRIAVLVIPTDKEQVISDEALTVMRAHLHASKLQPESKCPMPESLFDCTGQVVIIMRAPEDRPRPARPYL